MRRLRARPHHVAACRPTGRLFFLGTHGGAELDLLIVRGNRRLGFEFKRTTAPTVTPSTRAALRDLHLDGIVVVHAGSRSYSLDRRIRAISLDRVLEDVQPLR